MSKATSKANVSKLTLLLSIAFIALVAFVVFNLVVVFLDAARDRRNLDLASDLRALSYRVSGLARDATNGSQDAFAELESVIAQMAAGWAQLGAEGDELPAGALGRYQAALDGIRQQAEVIIAGRQTVLFLHDVVSTLNQRLPQLQAEHTQVVETLLDRRAPADQVAAAQAQSWRAERIGRNVDKMLAGGADAEVAADQFNRDANLFGRILEGMQRGDPALDISRVSDGGARQNLEQIAAQFEFVSDSVQEIFDATPALFRARQATDRILDQTPLLLEAGTGLTDAVAALPASRTLSYGSALAAGLVALILLALIGVQVYANTRRRLRDTAAANDRNQQAIHRLLDEIEGLGDGDLSAEATVTEDFTGAIADAINFAILQLRQLVARIQDTSENVSAAANETRATTLQLADASEHQAQEITAASSAINEMAAAIDQVSASAAESATVAARSVTIATNGANVVQSNVRGMDTIREQIQDTAKRIKRLGESSQEIGDIVSLISDIADQTNILALNAAIQASMAGDAGRGFAVVADEVQRLAERSASAAKQVAALVKTIQTDTNEAVSSMEQTTSEVVKGAQLAHDAGSALEEIQTVSATLAELIRDISATAKRQALSAGQVSRTMSVIQNITTQTTAATKATAVSIGDLAEMAVELRAFVADFKLPASHAQRPVIARGSPSLAESLAALDAQERVLAGTAPQSFDESGAGAPVDGGSGVAERPAAARLAYQE
ncbi:MAG: methyl-accepting chemotaxis protein [Porticoccaceae bacterium]